MVLKNGHSVPREILHNATNMHEFHSKLYEQASARWRRGDNGIIIDPTVAYGSERPDLTRNLNMKQKLIILYFSCRNCSKRINTLILKRSRIILRICTRNFLVRLRNTTTSYWIGRIFIWMYHYQNWKRILCTAKRFTHHQSKNSKRRSFPSEIPSCSSIIRLRLSTWWCWVLIESYSIRIWSLRRTRKKKST